ncbi:family 20 glycosylhydrolase [Spirosoma utsteinense]|uniref:beta-N-acetylhexosaminidase n=1 Tax=Spirosoma utsteinense TaxID=2585773 RepID=A0ABR6W8H0_9BACT|nr:family 20 glycosylhydrolase [Spirosoma utsteinense]MBC3787185.1 hexosaminidase [Spirosoma utsteinense]MBC3792869.1 hexosaminidase [Spirosoma utsteinense]
MRTYPFLVFVIFLQFIFFSCSKAPSTEATNAALADNTSKPLSVTLELADNNYQNQGRSRSVLTLSNTGDKDLPATGWKLFFNGGSPATFDSTVARVTLFNGDLHYISPGPKFKALPAGKSAKIEVLGGKIRNRTDFPGGFYLVLDSDPEQAFPVDVAINSGKNFEKSDRELAEKIFDENAKIKAVPADKLPPVFPTPVSYQAQGTPFLLNNEVTILARTEFAPEAAILARALKPAVGKELPVQAQGTGKTIALRKDATLPAEGYKLVVSQNGIELSAATRAGIFYGIQSLQTLLPAAALAGKAGSVSLPGVTITDAPRFPYRALMMDMARNFQPKSEVLKVLDIMALYKMNTFHFHFSEDEGWRVEMPSLPELTAVGAKRAHSTDETKNLIPSYGSGPSTSNTAGTGFYSKADFVDILKYARDRHIEVIPEIESPGHARAAIKAMDARYERFMKDGNKAEAERYLLRDLADKSVYRSVQGWDDNVINVAMPSAYTFMARVVDDLRSMYKEAGAPLKTIHFGGDEVPEGVWQKSPAVQTLLAGNTSVKNTDDLWYYYFGKVNQLLKSRGLFLSGWEEIGLKKVTQNGNVVWVPNEAFTGEGFRVNVWKNSPGSGAEDLAYRMANAGYKVILTGVTHMYLDLAYNPSSEEPGQYWGGYVDIDKPFSFIPYNYLRNLKDDFTGKRIAPSMIKGREAITEKGKANLVGIESPLWSETNRTPQEFEYKMLPKLLAVAERAWAKDPAWATEKNDTQSDQLYNQAWSEFINTVGKRELPRLDVYAGGYQYRIPAVGAKVTGGKVAANVQFPGLTIRYTTDGTEPTAKSQVYTEPVTATGPVKFKVFNASGRSGQTVSINP